jgi:two-component system chemotaxis sensor kinase CheA
VSRGDDALLAELRGVFRDELEDHLTTLERESVKLARSDAPTRAAAAAEIHRAIHSLKGAARAVAYPAIERFCHDLEARLGPLRTATAEDAPRIAASAEIARRALRSSAERLARGESPDDAALARALAEIDEPPPAAPSPPEPRAPSSRTIAAEPTSPARPSDAAAPPDTVRVSVARLGELLAAAEELLGLAGRQRDDDAATAELGARLSELAGALRIAREGRADERERALARALVETQTLQTWAADKEPRERAAWDAVGAAAAELVARSRALRVVPFASVAPTLERAALEAARALGREIVFLVEGAEIELDRRLLEGLREPLLHLVRNAVDHGIEPPDERAKLGKSRAGTVRLLAGVHGRDARVTVADDGRGIDAARVLAVARDKGIDTSHVAEPSDALALLFEAGFSLREDVTAISGRGVGLDVVRQRIAELHGRVDVESEIGHGTRFVLTAPTDLSVVRGLVARVRGVAVVFVSTSVERLMRVGDDDVRSIEGRLHLPGRASPVPLADLDEMLGLGAYGSADRQAKRPCVVVAAGEARAAFRVDALVDEREIVIKPAGQRVRRAAFVSATTILAGGEVALVLAAADLVRSVRPARTPDAAATAAPPRRRVLVVDDSVTTRQLERAILTSAGYEVATASDGQQAFEIISASEPFDLVVSDIEMPRMDGFQLVARLRASERTRRMPIVLVTALADDADRRRALELGADAYVIKSHFDQEELLETIAQLV